MGRFLRPKRKRSIFPTRKRSREPFPPELNCFPPGCGCLDTDIVLGHHQSFPSPFPRSPSCSAISPNASFHLSYRSPQPFLLSYYLPFHFIPVILLPFCHVFHLPSLCILLLSLPFHIPPLPSSPLTLTSSTFPSHPPPPMALLLPFHLPPLSTISPISSQQGRIIPSSSTYSTSHLPPSLLFLPTSPTLPRPCPPGFLGRGSSIIHQVTAVH